MSLESVLFLSYQCDCYYHETLLKVTYEQTKLELLSSLMTEGDTSILYHYI